MSTRTMIKTIANVVAGVRMYRYLPHGTDLLHDVERRLPNLCVETVFDVGANKGQSAALFLKWFPSCSVFCFEPVISTFGVLEHQYRSSGRVHCFNLALGAEDGQGRMAVYGKSDVCRMVNAAESKLEDTGKQTQQTQIETVDGFCRRKGIEKIGYLKIDTEGSDLDVLKGADLMLTSNRIDMVEVEAGMNCRNTWHVPLETLKQFLEAKKYFLFGVYEQKPEWAERRQNLRRANLLFVSDSVLAVNLRATG